jgi:hypothetical protein
VPRVHPASAGVGRAATDSSRYALAVAAERPDTVAALCARLPRVGLDGVLADLDRTGRPCAVPGDAAGDGFTWAPADGDDPEWWPQGVASVDSDRVLLVSWYAKRRWLLRTRGSRVTVVDRRDPAGVRYRHVLLVAPRRPLGLLTMGTVPVHAGGVAVLGDLLYVADTLAGVRVFRLSDVVRVPRRRLDALLPWAGAGTRTLGRRPTGGFTSYGYDYVLPQLLRLRVPRRQGPGRLRFSFLSVGRGDAAPTLVVGEYARKGTAPGAAPRLVRYPLNPDTGLPVPDAAGRCAPLEVHERQPHRMQGVAVHGSTWFVTASSGEGNPGDLYVGAPGALRRHRGVLPTGPEDVDWSAPGRELWCATEWPGRRWVFPIDVRRWPAPTA